MDIQALISWVTSNYDDVFRLWIQIIGVASIIVRLTPTLKDDDVLKNLMRFLGKYVALNR